ncbi:hypothetical protein [Accumulibacter sp.]|uniref:hypothetical protein n=1 Tax=Accumulibacter sp. TaxID=2053492 RepID=UPI001AD47765|nr:hypothetical protein [Accumulibacter sp.]MBN8454347.1 hypothetical protein [Accumulibacter sp.]MBO3706742.1 hypothetical protein [Candidatus Accumulibacter conexus]
MSKKIVAYVLIASFMLLPAVAKGYSIYGTTLDIQPNALITTQDTVSAVLGGEFPSTGYCGSTNPCGTTVTINGFNIDIDFRSRAPAGFALDVLVPFSFTASLGHLSPGTYLANAYFYVDDTLLNVVSPPSKNLVAKSFTVSAIPLPASLWLVVMGLLAIFCIWRARS